MAISKDWVKSVIVEAKIISDKKGRSKRHHMGRNETRMEEIK